MRKDLWIVIAIHLRTHLRESEVNYTQVSVAREISQRR